MNTYHEAGNPDDIAFGHELISSGKVGCIVLAGGDGSRLGWTGPKGTFPLSLVKQKSLFQMLEQRVAAASIYYGQELKLAIMTSPLNHESTKKAFSSEVDFFSQELVALEDLNGILLEEMRPNGNGEALKCFYKSGVFKKWKTVGIEFVQVILVDNPLAEPFDPNLIGVHARNSAEVTIKAIAKISPEEKVGVIGEKQGKICIVEYSENPPKEWNLASSGLFSFSMNFIEKIKDKKLPCHQVMREFKGKPVIKREYFLFDLLPYSEKTEVILYPRETIFAPLKNLADVAAVQQALLKRDREVFRQISGQEAPELNFELDAAFLYPTDSLKAEWKDRRIAEGYVGP